MAVGRYHVTQGQHIHDYLAIKAKIFYYFMLVIDDVRHLRWRTFVLMELKSRVNHPDWGQLSIMRCLHRNEDDAGYGAYPSSGRGYDGGLQDLEIDYHNDGEYVLLRCMLQIISDYYDREVVLFIVPQPHVADHPVPVPAVEGDAAPLLDPDNPRRDFAYEFIVAGHPDAEYGEQILLVTDDMLHFEPVQFVDEASPRFNTSTHFGDLRWMQMPWTERQYDEPEEGATAFHVGDINAPAELDCPPAYHPAYSLVDAATLNRFLAKKDIPGLMFNLPDLRWCAVPDGDNVMPRWNHECNPVDFDEDHFEEILGLASLHPLEDSYQIRHGPERAKESLRAEMGAKMILEALDVGKDEEMVARSHKDALEVDLPTKKTS